MLPIHIAWEDTTGANVYRGADWGTDAWIENELVEGVLQPNSYSDIFTVVMQNTAQDRRLASVAQDGSGASGTLETFINVKLYLDADDPEMVDLLVNQWPALDAGVELSFDQGFSWKRISPVCGNPADPSTWILLAGSAVTEGAPDGQLGPFPPFNRATVQVRIKTPQVPTSFGLFQFQLVPDCDVL
jgi:hypothetical protein